MATDSLYADVLGTYDIRYEHLAPFLYRILSIHQELSFLVASHLCEQHDMDLFVERVNDHLIYLTRPFVSHCILELDLVVDHLYLSKYATWLFASLYIPLEDSITDRFITSALFYFDRRKLDVLITMGWQPNAKYGRSTWNAWTLAIRLPCSLECLDYLYERFPRIDCL